MINNNFIAPKGAFKKLKAYQVTECIYDVTYYFAHKYLRGGDRTVDQMVQAARSGKQNIAEGSSAAATSRETQLKLTNVAKASLQELLIDYEDYLRVRGLEQWPFDSEKARQTRNYCMKHNDSASYREAIQVRSDETIANIAITLIHQADTLLLRLIEYHKRDFLQNGGIREEMTRARRAVRNNQNNQINQSNPINPINPTNNKEQ
jgi:four helix bundle suffix protein